MPTERCARALDERPKDLRGGARVVERRVGRRLVHTQHLDEVRQARRLTFRQVEDEARERRRVDDRMLERALEATTDEPRVEGVVAVLDQHRSLRKA
jgi:hypothetical protein